MPSPKDDKWKFLNSGSYNFVFENEDKTAVLKVPKDDNLLERDPGKN